MESESEAVGIGVGSMSEFEAVVLEGSEFLMLRLYMCFNMLYDDKCFSLAISCMNCFQLRLRLLVFSGYGCVFEVINQYLCNLFLFCIECSLSSCMQDLVLIMISQTTGSKMEQLLQNNDTKENNFICIHYSF